MFKVQVSCIAAVLVVTVVVATDLQTSDDLQQDDDRYGKGFRFGWNTMGGEKRSCVGMNGRPGVCMGQDQCANMNGKSVGKCFPFDSCCSITPNSCGGYSGYSTAYFQSPDKFQEMCSYKINIRRNVCQLRIDFEKFSIGQPTKRNNESAYYCEHDELVLLSKENMRIKMPTFCGENSGQHVYVPINQQTSSDFKSRQHVTLRFELTSRDESFNEPEPLWKLKISQLECPNTQTSWLKIKDIARQVWDWEEEDRDAGERSKYSLAPEGCLQYFTDQKGSFESFNYNRGVGHYTANLNYAVCFKRQKYSCGIRHEAVGFQVAYRQNATGFTDRDCDTAAATPAPTTTARPFTTERAPTTTKATTSTSTSTTTARVTTSTSTTAASTTAATAVESNSTTDAPPTTTDPVPTTTDPVPTTTDAAATTTDPVPTNEAPTTARRRSAESLGHAIFFAEAGLVRVDAARAARRRSFGGARGDYLLVPDGAYAGDGLPASKYCGNSMEEQANYVTTVAQGPLFVTFVSDDYSDPNVDTEKGFKINYSITNSGC